MGSLISRGCSCFSSKTASYLLLCSVKGPCFSGKFLYPTALLPVMSEKDLKFFLKLL